MTTRSSIPTAANNAALWAALSPPSRTLQSAVITASAPTRVTAVYAQRDPCARQKRAYSITYLDTRDHQQPAFVPTPPADASHDVHAPSGNRFLRFRKRRVEHWADGALAASWPCPHGQVLRDDTFAGAAWHPSESMVVYVADAYRPEFPNRSGPRNRGENNGEQHEEDNHHNQHDVNGETVEENNFAGTENANIDEEDGDEASRRSKWQESIRHQYASDAALPLGETYIARHPTLFIADLRKGRTQRMVSDSEQLLLADPQWSPDGCWIVAIARSSSHDDHLSRFDDALPHRLGLRYCYNRSAAVYAWPAASAATDCPLASSRRVSAPSEFACSSPRFSPRGHLVYLHLPRADLVQPHNSAKELRIVRTASDGFSPPIVLVPIPDDPAHDQFPGLYIHALPPRPWLPDGTTLALSSVWGSVNHIRFFSTEAKPQDLSNNNPQQQNGNNGAVPMDWLADARPLLSSSGFRYVERCSLSVLDVVGDVVLISASNPVTPIQLFLLRVRDSEIVSIDAVTKPSILAASLSDELQSYQTVDLVAQEPHTRDSFHHTARLYDPAHDAPADRFQVTLLRPSASATNSTNDSAAASSGPEVAQKYPHLIVYPHGGPHVTTLNAYSQGTMAFLRKGYAVLYINYRGSLGLGDKSLYTLPGNIGTQDINEVVQATRWALAQYPYSGASFVGGSHSGFIGAHTSLIPRLFHRTVLRNPVVDLASMQGGTDIPDWCFCEANVTPLPGLIADADGLMRMWQKSPMRWIASCPHVAKTLLQLGGGDRRVPVGQGLLWQRALQGRFGNVCQVRFYPDIGHAVDDVPAGDDAWVSALDFLDEGRRQTSMEAFPPIVRQHSLQIHN